METFALILDNNKKDDNGVTFVEKFGDIVAFTFVLSIATLLALNEGFRKRIACKRKNVWRILKDLPINPWISVAMLMVLLPILGGCLNRFRGGWQLFGLNPGDTLKRLSLALPTGFIFHIILGGDAWLGIALSVFSFLGLIEGWGCYFSMAEKFPWSVLHPHTDCAYLEHRYGMFDFFLGKPNISWTREEAWNRDYAGMSMRGLAWTLPLGIAMHAGGHGSLWMLAGSLMGAVYHIGHHVHSKIENFKQGVQVAEFLFGASLYLLYTLAALNQAAEKFDEEVEVENVCNNQFLISSQIPLLGKPQTPSIPRKMANSNEETVGLRRFVRTMCSCISRALFLFSVANIAFFVYAGVTHQH